MGIVKWLKAPLLLAASAGFLLLPGAWRLRRRAAYQPTTLNGVTNLRDAILNCRRTGLQGWNLVAYAQQLVSRKFTIYSALNLWDPPDRAFVVGMGYCTQYNLALRALLDRLDFNAQTVFSLKVKMLNGEPWDMGHTWLRVTIGEETRDVCAGRVENEPGSVNFVPVWPVLSGHPLVMLGTHMGTIYYCGVLQWWALLRGSPPPEWMFQPEKRKQA